MRRKRIIILIVICFLVFFSIISSLLNVGLIQIRFPWLESPSRIITNRERTDKEQILEERLRYVITEMDMIQDCKVAVLLDELFYHIVVALTLESNLTFSDFDSQAVRTIICYTMSTENVSISEENISLSIGLSE